MHSFWRCPSARCSWSCRQCGGMCWSPRPDPRHVASFLPDVFWDDVLHRRHHNDNIEIHPISIPPQINAYFIKWFLVTFIKLYSTWGWGWDKNMLYSHLQQYKISCCHHRTNPFTMLISIKSREADSSRIFFFLHFVLPHFLKSTKQTSDLSINLKILLELLRRVGCNM